MPTAAKSNAAAKRKRAPRKQTKKAKPQQNDAEPYMNYARPTEMECQAARDILADAYGARPQGEPQTPPPPGTGAPACAGL